MHYCIPASDSDVLETFVSLSVAFRPHVVQERRGSDFPRSGIVIQYSPVQFSCEKAQKMYLGRCPGLVQKVRYQQICEERLRRRVELTWGGYGGEVL